LNKMNLIEESFQRLFPEEIFHYQHKLEYNRRLADFNANVRLHHNLLSINLNLQWKDIDDEIKIGLIQSLLLKILKKRAHTPNLELYHNFIKKIPILTPKDRTDQLLEAAFRRVNLQFFSNQLELPNLQWGQQSFRKLAYYNFHDDSITVSTIFQKARTEVLDYIMYHEMLHKHHQFNHKNNRSSFHTKQLRAEEELYPNHQALEQEISLVIKQEKKLARPKPKSIWNFWR